jgi:hypothetical protein
MLTKLHQWFLCLPHKFHWFFVLLTGVLVPFLTRHHPEKDQRGEWYPFSNFPMYSTFEDTAYYVRVTDLQDKPLAFVPVFNKNASEVKKLYNGYLNDEVDRLKKQARDAGGKYRKTKVQMTGEECRPAGDATLRELQDRFKPSKESGGPSGLRLYQVDITLDEGQIVRRPKKVGEVNL